MNAWGRGWQSLIAGFDQALDDECVYANLGFPTWHGKKQIMSSMDATRQEFGLEKIVVEYQTVVESGEHVVVERLEHWFGTDGLPLFSKPEPAMGIFRVRNGKVIEVRDYFDPRTFLAVLDRRQSKSKAFFE
jgi:limonene-1,2-epoxide hydrolase